MSNIELFPKNILTPEKLIVGDTNYTLYRATFSSLSNLHKYLTSNPEINKRVFRKLCSVDNDFDFAGEPYKKAVELLASPLRQEYTDFLSFQKKIDSTDHGTDIEYLSTKSVAGGVIDVPNYVSGSPLCYTSETEYYDPKFIRLNIYLGYDWHTSKSQVKNKAFIVLALIDALEREGFVVDINSFKVLNYDDELVYVNINLKNSNDTLNRQNLVKALCYVEFSRRILFRVLETLPVRYLDWADCYGHISSEHLSSEVLKLRKQDLYIDTPDNLNINGHNIVEDFKEAVECLKLDDTIDVDKSVFNLKKFVKGRDN